MENNRVLISGSCWWNYKGLKSTVWQSPTDGLQGFHDPSPPTLLLTWRLFCPAGVFPVSTSSLQSQEHCISCASLTESPHGGELGRHVTGDRCGLPRQVSLVPHLRSWPISSSSVRLITLIFTHNAYHHWYYCFIYLVLFSRLLSVVSSTAAPSAMKRTSFLSYSDLLQA